ncbi:MAG: signal peptidase II [Candidatus Omnitrophica bacterium]|nr:signal peptidase II [Candidatus Omnitrophota bacterium]MDD5042633.1 signal peptidase II [Candidatus Omnitrophota bacterium]MDD5500228.1 signal peptidase II [Candidatus Omnitrophota bacterium]
MILSVISGVVLLDQASKYLALRFLQPNTPFALIDNFLYLTLVRNSGAAFGMLKNQLLLFVAISLFAIIFILLNLKKKNTPFLFRISLALILAGAIGNLIDRLRFGYVIDFLDLRFWPVFNLADSALTVGALLLGWGILFKRDAA